MVYVPAKPTVFVPELVGNATAYGTLLANIDSAYVDYAPPIVGPVATKFQVGSTTNVLVAEWQIRGNADAVPMYCTIRWRGTTGFTATATFEVDDGSTSDSDTVTSTTDSWSTDTIVVTPSTNVTPRFGRLYLRINDAAQRTYCANLVSGYAPSSFAAGALPSGCAKFGGAWLADGLPITTEAIERAHNNLRNLARDRVCGIAGGFNRSASGPGAAPPGPTYETSSSSLTLVDRWLVPYTDTDRRPYFFAFKLAGTDPEVMWRVGGATSHVSGAGFWNSTEDLALSKGMQGEIYLRSTSGGACSMSTWQIQRGL